MAYVPQPQDEEERRKAEAKAGGALGSFGSTQGSASGTTQPKFVNVADYLSKNPSGSAQIGDLASGKLTEQREAANSAVSAAKTGFNSAVQSGTTNLDSGLLDSALTDPSTFTQDANNVAKFAALRDAQYKGPESVQGTEHFAPTQSKVTGLGSTAESLGNESGRNALVSSLSANPNKGKTSLNQLLLQGSPEASQKVVDTASTFKPVEDDWSAFLNEATGTANRAREATDLARTTTQSRLGETIGSMQTSLADRLSKQRADANASNQALSSGVSGRNLTPEQLSSLGIEQSDWDTILSELNTIATPRSVTSANGQFGAETAPIENYDLMQWLSQSSPDTDLTRGNTATADEYAREAALEQLSGNQLDILNNDESGLAGTAPSKFSTFKGTDAREQLQGISSDQLSAAQAYADALAAGADEEHAQLAAMNAQKNAQYRTVGNTAVGASEAAFNVGTGAGKEVYDQYKSPEAAGKSVAANVATAGLYTPGKAAIKGVKSAANKIEKVFCFAADTLISMADGTTKAIRDIMLGDDTKGGTVRSLRISMSDHIYNYYGVYVTGEHAVLDDNWVRVKNAPGSERINEKTLVYSLVTDDHRIYVSGMTFADEHETDEYENLSLDESLAKLNEQSMSWAK